MIRHVVLDIEGTTSPISAVHEVLFPYARARLEEWVHRSDPAVAHVVTEVRGDINRPGASLDEIVAVLRRWIDEDRKVAPLKTLQGLIWEHGFADGELVAEVYDDVPPALRDWTAAGLRCWIYSSGSRKAQQQWFGHTGHGDLTGYLSGYFDIPSAGPKKEAASYRRIQEAVGGSPDEFVFLSDVAAELDAAAMAGWHTIGVRREGAPEVGDHRSVPSFSDMRLEEFVR
ncbi:enolase-phosphatase E1 [Longimycelium tulufanense]|uniref:Enolase-phosphatase E1 n=1 Tax=Longimycelium tulufanense TaxID=907463 RepID=A0A8J3C6E4_9PSEU|nr:acireductone synthase [Longimycelium tulufanense]GGM40046.1 enolase-phosphatase E1 [Longimycelium tulufanense]